MLFVISRYVKRILRRGAARMTTIMAYGLEDLPMPRTGLRSCVVDSAKWMCERVTEHGAEQPCSACIWNVSRLHAEFLSSLPRDVAGLPPEVICALIRQAGLDG